MSDELPTHRTEGPADRATETAFGLVVVEGPDAGASVVLEAASSVRVLVGTSPMCTLRLSDRAVSRRHVAFRAHEGVLVATDLGSTNGTTINGVSMREAALRGGEFVAVGSTVLSIRRGDALPSVVADASFGRVLGRSVVMRRLFLLLHDVARSDRAVLLDGEAGVGKELVAEEIHAHSSRTSRPFVVVAVHALDPNAVEERLFGEAGLLCDSSGTVYIDEVAALPPSVQARLVAFVDRPAPERPRLVLGTKRDLDRDVVTGRFREDLLAKLATCRVEVPALRDRPGDVQVIAEAVWEALAADDPEQPQRTLPPDFVPRFESYPWPGNVRELELAVTARYNLGEMGRWRSGAGLRRGEDFLGAVVEQELPLSDARKLVVEEFERRYVGYMMARHGNSRDAAAASGVALRYFQLLRARDPR